MDVKWALHVILGQSTMRLIMTSRMKKIDLVPYKVHGSTDYPEPEGKKGEYSKKL